MSNVIVRAFSLPLDLSNALDVEAQRQDRAVSRLAAEAISTYLGILGVERKPQPVKAHAEVKNVQPASV